MANTGNTQQIINYGATANDGTGDPLRTAFIKTDENFDNVWLAGPVGSNITIGNNTVQSNNTNGNIILKPNGTGIIQANASILPNSTDTRDLGSAALEWRRAYVETLTVSGDATVTGNLTAGNIRYTGNVFVGDLQGSVFADDSTIMVDAIDNSMFADSADFGVLTVDANVTANYFIGNGSQLTGIASYANANAVAYGQAGWAGNIIPAANAIYSLGNATNYWSNIWVANNTIYIGGVPLGISSGNVLTVGGEPVLSNDSNTAITTTGNISANYFIGNGSLLTGISSTGDFVFANNQMSVANTAMEIVATGTGADVDIEAADAVFIEALGSEVDIRSADDTFITTNSGGNIWTFGANAVLQAPGNISVTGNIVVSPGIGTLVLGRATATGSPGLNSTTSLTLVANSAGTTKELSFNTSGDLSAPGNVSGGNLTTAGQVVATGNITAGNFVAPASTANTYVLYNDSGVIGGSGVFTFNENGNALTIGTTGGTLKVADISTPQAGVNLRLVPSTGLTYSYGNFSPLFANTYDLGGTSNRWNNIWANVANVVTLSASGNITAGNLITTANVLANGYALLTGSFDESQASTAGLYLGYAGGTARIMFGTGNTSQTLEIDNDGGTLRFYKPGTTLASLTNSGVFTATGNVTGGNIVTGGLVSATGNVSGSNLNATGDITGDVLISSNQSGIEGGEINLSLPAAANTTLSGNIIVIDSYGDRLRFFEGGGSTRGLYMDLANSPAGVGAAIGYRDIPQVTFSANATAAISDAGKHFYSTTAGNLSLLIPTNTNVAFPTGATLTVVVNAAGNVLVNADTGVSLYIAGSSTTGNRVVGAYGLASVMKVATDTWVISGTGVY